MKSKFRGKRSCAKEPISQWGKHPVVSASTPSVARSEFTYLVVVGEENEGRIFDIFVET